MIITFILYNQNAKSIPNWNCDVSFANGELQQACATDGEAYSLPMTYDRILVTCSSATSRDHMPDEVRRWRTKHRN